MPKIPFSAHHTVVTSTPIKTTGLEEHMEVELEGTSSMFIPEELDPTYDADESITDLTTSADMSWVNDYLFSEFHITYSIPIQM